MPRLFELLPDVVLFVAVARARSFSRAAKGLGMPVSTLSRRVGEFEAQLGIPLLVRSTRQVELTEVGRRYFERCERVVAAAEAAQDELLAHRDQPRGLLRVSATEDFALTFLSPIFAEIATRYPAIAFELDLTPRSVDLIGEGFDVAIRMGPLPDSQLTARHLGVSQIGLYAAPTYAQRAGMPQSPAELAEHECLRIAGHQAEGGRWVLRSGADEAVVAVRGRFVANSMCFLLELATRGVGIVAIDDVVARRAVSEGQLVRVLPAWRPPAVPVHALTPSKLQTARARIFLACLRDHLRIPPAEPGAS